MGPFGPIHFLPGLEYQAGAGQTASSRRGLTWHQDKGVLCCGWETPLSKCQWIHSHLSVLITGATGAGKTFMACALANAACRLGLSARYYRVPRLFQELRWWRVGTGPTPGS